MQNDVVIRATDNSPAAMIQSAVQGGADLDKLEKLLELQMRWEENEARKAYHEAMAAFKANPPDIDKDKHVRFETAKGRTEYNHATLANVTGKISAGLSKHGLSASWKTKQDGDRVSVTCCITHEQGHHEETSLSGAPDLSGGKNAIQAIGSTVSYLERYTLLALTGLATREQDNDGMGGAVKTITEEQAADLQSLATEVKADIKAFNSYFKITAFSELPSDKFALAVKLLEAKRKGK